MSVFSNTSIKFPWFLTNIANKPLALWIIFSTVPIVGLFMDFAGVNLAFSRSGSVLVAIAICSVYLNHFLSIELQDTKGALTTTLKLGKNKDEIMKRMNPAITGDSRIQAATSMEQLINSAQAIIPEYEKIRRNIVTVEFIAGVSGTLIWGFGDLIN